MAAVQLECAAASGCAAAALPLAVSWLMEAVHACAQPDLKCLQLPACLHHIMTVCEFRSASAKLQ
jgi:hypothetical protein